MAQWLRTLVLQRTWVWYPGPTRWDTTICNLSSRGSGPLFWPPQVHIHTVHRYSCRQSTQTHKIMIKILNLEIHCYVLHVCLLINTWGGAAVWIDALVPKLPPGLRKLSCQQWNHLSCEAPNTIHFQKFGSGCLQGKKRTKLAEKLPLFEKMHLYSEQHKTYMDKTELESKLH